MKISLIIATKNRPSQLNICLNSVSKTISPNDNVVIVDQSSNSSALLNQHTVKNFTQKLNLLYIHSPSSGISLARNIGINKALGDILAFTDDDCLVDKQWFNAIHHSFLTYPEISGVIGSTLPHGQPPATGQMCPCTHRVKKISLIQAPQYHANIGFGNCMAFRRTALLQSGPFKQWLGVGSIGMSAEDAKIILHLLIQHKSILNNPAMIVYHNRWLTSQEMKQQQLLYNCGEMACYGYFAFRGHQFAKQVVWRNIKESFFKTIRSGNRFILLETIYRLRGLLIGVYFSLYENIVL